MRRIWVAVVAGLGLAGCGGYGPGPNGQAIQPTVRDVSPPTFAGDGGTLTLTVPTSTVGQPVRVIAETTAPDGTPVPTSVSQEGNQVTIVPDYPPNLTTRPQTYSVTVTAVVGTQTVTQTQTVVVPGLDAPAPPGGAPPVNGPAGPEFGAPG